MDRTEGSTQLTIDQLAQRTRLTVRNIRAYQSRGLVPPPELRGRTGYYGEEHIARIKLIRELQSEGFNLAGDPAPDRGRRRRDRRGPPLHAGGA